MDKITNVLIVGVGGQGVILASEIISEAAMLAGYDAKKSEVHGMSQRGGVVSSHIRFGRKVYSPLIPNGEADVVLAFEAAEGLRWAHQAAENGLLVINTQKIVPPIAFTKGNEYPLDPIRDAKGVVRRTLSVDALDIAQKVGNPKLVNTVLLGAVAAELGIDDVVWETVIRKRVPRGTEEANLLAFKMGAESSMAEATA